MLKLSKILRPTHTPLASAHRSLTLPYERRLISRQRVALDDGSEAGLFLPRGSSLQDGAYLTDEHGVVVRVQAAVETVSTLYCPDPLLLARACYHLGNRHVPVQIRAGQLSYLHDPVLDAMLHGLGLPTVIEQATFEPEAGAYAHGLSSTAHAH